MCTITIVSVLKLKKKLFKQAHCYSCHFPTHISHRLEEVVKICFNDDLCVTEDTSILGDDILGYGHMCVGEDINNTPSVPKLLSCLKVMFESAFLSRSKNTSLWPILFRLQ